MNMLAVFRVDAGIEIGAGHFMRCLALAAEFSRQRVRILFLVNSETKGFIHSRADFSYDYRIVDIDDEFASIFAMIVNQQVGFFVLDGYHFGEVYRHALKQRLNAKTTLVLLDDCNNSGQLYADVVLNPVSEAFNLNYSHTAPKAKLLLGPGYTLLRPEFVKPNERAVDTFSKSTQCVITFGASDFAGLTLPLLSSMLNNDFSMLNDDSRVDLQRIPNNILVITGAGFAQNDVLEPVVSRHSKVLRHAHDVSDMAAIMRDAKCVISAAGGTVFELAALGLPSILIVVADNQLNAAMEQEQKGWCVVVDARHAIECEASKAMVTKEIVSVLQGLWNNEAHLYEMHKKAINSAVYDGAQKAVCELLALSRATFCI